MTNEGEGSPRFTFSDVDTSGRADALQAQLRYRGPSSPTLESATASGPWRVSSPPNCVTDPTIAHLSRRPGR